MQVFNTKEKKEKKGKPEDKEWNNSESEAIHYCQISKQCTDGMISDSQNDKTAKPRHVSSSSGHQRKPNQLLNNNLSHLYIIVIQRCIRKMA